MINVIIVSAKNPGLKIIARENQTLGGTHGKRATSQCHKTKL